MLEVPSVQLEGISGTSAGAMNAAALVSGYHAGGKEGARESLDRFWRGVSDAARYSPFKRGLIDMITGSWSLDNSPVYLAAELATRLWSPYDLNPRGMNPLAGILADLIDFEHLAASPIKLFVTATNVRTGRGRVFRNAEMTPEVLMASACLPTLFHAVEIEGDPYWDGGYAGNPTMTPLIRECQSSDTILVQINPIERPGTPRSASEINNRLNELSFNSPLLKELRMIALLRKVADPGHGEGAAWARMRIHRISTDAMLELGASSKMISEWPFLCKLRDEGRRSAQAFIDAHRDDIGKRSTLDLDALLEGV